MDLLSLRLFLRIADTGGVSSAARDLSLSPASASARLARLEEAVGFRLFARTTRAVTLTTDGRAFLPYAQQALETLDTGLGTVRGDGSRVRGLLRMAMPGSFGRMHIVPLLGEFRARYPQVVLDLRLSDEVVNVVEGAFDLVIRNAPLADSALVARKLADDRRLLVAAPAYLERHGTPATPADLAEHACVSLAGNERWLFASGEVVTLAEALAVNDGEAMRMLLEQGAGIGIKSLWNAKQSLRAGTLVEVLPDEPLVTDSAIWALHPSGRVVAPKVRAMIDFLVASFQPAPPWEV
ncbi:MAG: LysR family transcriptional regulator [Pseudomonadota bacterium]